MGRYKAERIVIKILPELTLIFWDNSSIYLFPKNGQTPVVFHKWFAPRFTYTNSWRQFRDKLWHLHHGSVKKCFQLAYEHDVVYEISVGRLDLRKKLVEIRYKNWAIKGVGDGMLSRTTKAQHCNKNY